jgi:hypothetical protein
MFAKVDMDGLDVSVTSRKNAQGGQTPRVLAQK